MTGNNKQRMKTASPPAFKSRLRPLTHFELERLSPAALQRREALEAQERQEWGTRNGRSRSRRESADD